jgi:RNA recognition motif-containing protein
MAVSVIVDHLPLEVGEQDLAEVFRPFGPVLSIRIVRAGRGQSLAFGFVEFATMEQACSAVLSLNGQEIAGQQVTVALAEDSTSTPP